MTVPTIDTKKMPLESLDAYRIGKEVLQKVLAAQIRDARLRDQAVGLRSRLA